MLVYQHGSSLTVCLLACLFQEEIIHRARKRFQQKVQSQTTGVPQGNEPKGQIKVLSTKVFEQLMSVVEEQSTLVSHVGHTIPTSQYATLSKSPVDDFNLQIAKQQEWGKTHFGGGTGNDLHQYAKHRTTEKDIAVSVGKNKVKPRERIIMNSATTHSH